MTETRPTVGQPDEDPTEAALVRFQERTSEPEQLPPPSQAAAAQTAGRIRVKTADNTEAEMEVSEKNTRDMLNVVKFAIGTTGAILGTELTLKLATGMPYQAVILLVGMLLTAIITLAVILKRR